MDMAPRVKSVRPLEGRTIEVTFEDNAVRTVNLLDRPRGGVWKSIIDDDATFKAVSVDPVSGTVCWPNGVDLDPDVIYGLYEPAWKTRKTG